MKHARKDYDPIQDPRGLIPEDEPVFLLRGQDVVAPKVVEAWAMAAHNAGAKDDIVEHAYKHAQAMRKWQEEHKTKIPDMPTE
ncbi:unnamed protein product [marine sediment metagenome]|uniref:Uncharacterized protein n=1 Tax=marine sediment metagenome TaxID=412755 RepID=X1NIU7_9ZZZZ